MQLANVGSTEDIQDLFKKTIAEFMEDGLEYVSYKDLKAVYATVDEQADLAVLDIFSEHWDKKYPKISPRLRRDVLTALQASVQQQK